MDIKTYELKTLECKNCGKQFTFSIGEQRFYDEKQLSSPTRCKECRDAKKKQFEQNKPVERNESTTNYENKITIESKPSLDDLLEKFKENTIYFDSKEQYRNNSKKKKAQKK